MKKLLIAVSAVVVVIIAAVLIAPMFVPVDAYRDEITKQVREATGRELTLGGDVSFSILPRLGLTAENVAFSNAPGAREPQMATLKSLEVDLRLWPLISGEVVINRFVLVEPEIHLEVDARGRPNWQLEGMAKVETPPGQSAPSDQPADSDGPALSGLSLGDVRLVNGTITYFDAASKQSFRADKINMSIALPSLDQAMDVDGSLRWNEQEIELKARVETPARVLGGEPAEFEAGVSSEPLSVEFKGTLERIEPVKLQGEARISVPSIRELAAWTGNPIEFEGEGLGPFDLSGVIDLDDKRYAFRDVRIAVDEITGTGEVAVDTAGKVPAIAARLDVEDLNLNPYLPPEAAGAEQAGAPASGGGGASDQGPSDWSDEPIDVSALRLVNADLAVSARSIHYQQIKVGESALSLALKDGRMRLQLTKLDLYEGKGSGTLNVNGAGKTPAIDYTFSLESLQAGPLLADAAGFDRLTGTATAALSGKTKGRTQREMVSNLNGKGSFKVLDGGFRGVNLAAMVRNVSVSSLAKGFDDAQTTDFAELTGTYVIQSGQLRNDDLRLIAPLIRATGKGTANLPKRTIDYRLVTTAVASIQGQGGDEGKKGLRVPILITGTFDDPSFQPDVKALLEEGVGDPKSLIEGGGAKELLDGVLGGSKSEAGQEKDEKSTSPLKQLEGLFKRN